MMRPLEKIFRKPGRFVLKQYFSFIENSVLLFRILRGLKGIPKTANFKVFTRQLYFTAVQPLPIILTGAFAVGAVAVTFIFASLSSLGLSDKVGKLVLIILVDELAPVFIAVVVMIRSGSAIIAELALMKLNREIETLRSLGVDLYEYLIAPRFASLLVSNVLLSVLFSLVAILGGFFAYGYLHNIPFYDYVETMATAADIPDFVTIYVKPLFFGLTIALLSIRNGLDVSASITEVPVRLLVGLMRQAIFILIFIILYDIFRYGNILQ
jgi:phospholipid/cholesterol/gamma-HCH transport system permease protein